MSGNLPEVPHTVEWDTYGHATFRCHGEADAACRIYPDCECEVWFVDESGKHPHPSVPQAECWKLTWLEACDADDTYMGDGPMREVDDDDEWLPSLPLSIVTEWTGDGLLWDYEHPKEEL